MLDEVAWLFNLRGNDIPYNPVFFSYAIVTPTETTLYIDSAKVSTEVKSHLGESVKIRPYEAVFEDSAVLAKISTESSSSPGKKVKYSVSNGSSWALVKALGGEDNVEKIRSPIADAKSVKNDIELEGVKACHVRDGAALIKFFAWLENSLKKGESIDEVAAADKLETFRSTGDHFVGLSFDTISSTGPNAAVIHYKPEKGSCSIIDPKAIYLCDSGAQYFDGTTDTTRTLHFGEPTDLERKAFTLVLKGNIALEQIVFPRGTSGYAIDVMARQFLWKEGLDYRHGTGHGVGHYLVSVSGSISSLH
jgi:Xaa-Pro aminopeptidase